MLPAGSGGVPSDDRFTVLTDVRPAAPPRPRRIVPAALADHRVFAVLLVLAAALRVVTMLGYRPAQLYWYDSFTYLDTAVRLKPSAAFHPIGYPLLLRVLWPFHSVELIAAVQHAMGLAIGVMIYALLRRRSLPGWGAALATVPPLFDASFLRLEHSVLSDTLFIFLIVAGLTTLMWSPALSARAATGAGLLFAAAALTRTIALPLLLLVLLVLAVQRAGRRHGRPGNGRDGGGGGGGGGRCSPWPWPGRSRWPPTPPGTARTTAGSRSAAPTGSRSGPAR
nr:hypothetical protein GCM10020093_064950 [Planobispora longispora]